MIHMRPSGLRPMQRPRQSLSSLVIKAESFWDKIKGGSSSGGSEDAARKAIQDSFSSKKFGGGSPKQQPGKVPPSAPQPPPTASGGPGGFGGFFSGAGGGGGGGGGGGWGGSGNSEGESDDVPIWKEFLQIVNGVWVVIWNTALFLAFANVLHRSLDWCCQIELLLLVGAPQQAFERLAAVFYSHVEAFEKNVLGWDIPGDDDTIPMYENVALYYPEEHAYSFDAYRYNVTESEKKTLRNFHALKHYERIGGFKGDVSPGDAQDIVDKYEPFEADRRAYQKARASGQLEEYWKSVKDSGLYDKALRA